MSLDGSVTADRLWKRFRADQPPRRLLETLERFPSMLRRGSGTRRWRWALRDVSFAITPGESVGLIGTNGSGKSTLLKILNQIMYPYAGTVEASGRVGALIDVRAGIHPQLTGRENVFMFGALLGLGRTRVADRFDEIVEFAELEHAIDRQVKFFSSGMQMRLGFAVAAFLEPDVLLVDEVLAVGDTAFQQRCLDKMRAVHQAGTTIVLVSHDLSAVEATCERTIWLHDGVVAADGDTGRVLEQYRSMVEAAARFEMTSSGPVRIVKVEAHAPAGGPARTHGPVDVVVRLDADGAQTVRVVVGFTESVPSPVFVVEREVALARGETALSCRIDRLPLPHGRYALWATVTGRDGRDLVTWRPVADLDVVGPTLPPGPGGVARAAPVVVQSTWEVKS
jgi:ABC-2 type transport system ATP-binding protein